MEAVATVSSTSQIQTTKAPGHWVLARLGKRVLRPGGVAGTRALLDNLQIWKHDHVVEFAPGLGLTAEMILNCGPASYTAVERDAPSAARLQKLIGKKGTVVNADAQDTGLQSRSATKLVGEAMLSMHRVDVKRSIMAEASRLLVPGGAYGIHELVLTPGNAPQRVRSKLARGMSSAIHHGVAPISTDEWCGLLEEQGLLPADIHYVPFRLLEPSRLIADEGITGAAKFALNLVKDADARRRVMEMRRGFEEVRNYLSAIVIVSRKRG